MRRRRSPGNGSPAALGYHQGVALYRPRSSLRPASRRLPASLPKRPSPKSGLPPRPQGKTVIMGRLIPAGTGPRALPQHSVADGNARSGAPGRDPGDRRTHCRRSRCAGLPQQRQRIGRSGRVSQINRQERRVPRLSANPTAPGHSGRRYYFVNEQYRYACGTRPGSAVAEGIHRS